MGLDIANNYLQETCFVLAIVGVAVAIAATVLRFVAVRLADRRPGWEDVFSVLATLFFILYVIPLLYLLTVMNGSSTLTAAEAVQIKKAGYAMGPQFCLQQMFAKLSLLFLYYRIFSVNRTFVVWVWILGALQVAWSIATYFAHWFECTPVAKDWDPTLPGTCINSAAFLAAGETPNSLLDFALIGLAIWMVQSLHIKTSAKLKLVAIFVFGGLAGVLGFVKIGYGFSATSKAKVELLDPIWAVAQQTCSVICCCAPVYKTLIPDLGAFEKLRSLTSTIWTRTTGSGSRATGSGSRTFPSHDTATNDPTTTHKVWRQNSDDWVELDHSSSRKTSSSHV